MKDLLNWLGTDAIRSSILPAARAATVNGSGVDLQGYEGATMIAETGAWAGNQGTWALTIQDSTDNVTFVAAASTDLIGTALTLSGQINRGLMGQSYKGNKRYIRATGTLTGGGTNTTFGVSFIRGFKRHLAP